MLSASATPTQKAFQPQQSSSLANALGTRGSLERDGGSNGLQLPAPNPRNLSSSTMTFAPRGSSLNPITGPGSFSSELRSQVPSTQRAPSRAEIYARDKAEEDEDLQAVQTLTGLREALNREVKIKEGSENMLEALNNKKAKQSKEYRARVEAELNASNHKIKELRNKISEAQRTRAVLPTTPTRNRTTETLFQSNGLRSPRSASRSGANSDVEEQQTESPTFALAELLQALEVEGMTPEYYVSRANSLVDLFKRHPTLKYDLVWAVFGLRMQVMLLSESREVVAAGYRMTRYAISDVSSLKKIRALNTDYLIATSLIKDRKADVEREQALKLVRAFLDVKDGVKEVSRAVVRTIAALAEHGEDRHGGRPAIETIVEREDRLRPICIETLAEILSRDPALLVASGGLAPLAEAFSEGTYKAPEGLTSAFLFLLDKPRKRKYLQPGYGIESLFSPFTDQLLENQSLLKQNAKAIAGALKNWAGLMTLCMYDFRTIKALIESMLLPHPSVRETVIDLLYSLLRIKSPGWAQSFVAGRRLTTYGRAATLKSSPTKQNAASNEEDMVEQNFVEHYTALLLAIFIKAGLLPTLLRVNHTTDNPTQKRKTTLLLGEVLKLASRLLPPSWSSDIQLLPELFAAAAEFGNEDRFNASATVYQISSVSRTLYRSSPAIMSAGASAGANQLDDDHPKASTAILADDATWRQMLLDSGVLHSSNHSKWNWDVIMKIIEGPLQIGKRLDEAAKASKFLKRIMSFYRPFKYKFAEIKSTRNTQKYVRAGCALMHSMIQSNEGTRFLADSKLLRQIAECLAQCDPSSGIGAQFPMFSKDRLMDTLCGGYLPMVGVLSSDPKGLQLLERWRMFNMMYHIIELKQRPDLIKLILSNFDYSINGHPRILLGKALTGGTVDIRIHATNTLRKYAVRPVTDVPSQDSVGDAKWAIENLVCQLYDPEIDVCATAVKILEKACNRKSFLEYIVQCRPSLDHLGEIGAPLLLRFLSTSIGYKYLDGLDYISNEMDDWFLGRNDTYVDLIEASLARAFMDPPHDHSNRMVLFDDAEASDDHESHVPPHFYRELTRTQEGCKLLSEKGHFDEFAATIREHGMECEDAETMTKVKGSLWAVGNVGSMELGAPFLESCDVVEQVVKIAQGHQVLSMRGTAFFVLGLISRSLHGLEILSEQGWDANCTPNGNSLGFCLPTELSRLFSLQPWPTERVVSIRLPDTQKTERTPPPASAARPPLEPQEGLRDDSDENAINQRVVDVVVDLCNTVLFKQAMNELIKLRQTRKGGFVSVKLFRRVMSMLEYNHYRLPIRKVVTELFHKSVLRKIVFDEGGGEDEKEEEDGAQDSSSGDEARTERQRSISDPADLEKDRRRRR